MNYDPIAVAIGIRKWGKYPKPFTFNIIVQSMDEVKNFKGERDDEHCMSNSQSRYVFRLDELYRQCCAYAILHLCSLDDAQMAVMGEVIFAE